MSVIATIITRHCTALASDSFITVATQDGSRQVIEDRASKLIRVPAWRGAMAYWGLATLGGDWNTKQWLEAHAAAAGQHVSAETFAASMASSLSREIGIRRFRTSIDSGLGIHFTAYEFVEGYWIPELFLVSNWTDASYTAVRPTGFLVTRETYATLQHLQTRPQEQRQPEYRRAVHVALHDNQLMFRFNNGDPTLFNPLADSVFGTFATLYSRGHVHDGRRSEPICLWFADRSMSSRNS